MKKIKLISSFALLALLALNGCNSSSNNNKYFEQGYKYEVILDGNGGTIGDFSTRKYIVKYDSLILPPGEDNIPSANKAGYILDGWYLTSTDENGNLIYEDKWDFKVDKVTENITLYAKWVQTYQVFAYCGDNNSEVRTLANYDDATAILNAPISSIYKDYTILEYYYDAELTQKFEFGSAISSYFADDESERQLYLYTKYLNGKYTLISEASQLQNLRATANYYLLNDIICDTNTVYKGFDTYSGIFDGNGKTIKNMTISQTQSGVTSIHGLFKTLENSTLKNVTFDNLTINVTVGDGKPEVAFIACKVKGNTIIDNVKLINSTMNITIDGSITQNDIFTGEIYRSKDDTATVKDNCIVSNNVINYLGGN